MKVKVSNGSLYWISTVIHITSLPMNRSVCADRNYSIVYVLFGFRRLYRSFYSLVGRGGRGGFDSSGVSTIDRMMQRRFPRHHFFRSDGNSSTEGLTFKDYYCFTDNLYSFIAVSQWIDGKFQFQRMIYANVKSWIDKFPSQPDRHVE